MATYRLRIERVVSDGSGLARTAEGKVVLVPQALPGEEVEAEAVREHRDYIWARLLRLLGPSAERRDPLCPHFGDCGGCDLQHLPYEGQVRLKKSWVEEAFRRLTGGRPFPEVRVVPSPTETGYRNTAVFHGRDGVWGYFAKASERVVVPSVCPVLEAGILERFRSLDLGRREGEVRVRKDNTGRIVTSLDEKKHNEYEVAGLRLRVWIRNFFQNHTALLPAWLGVLAEMAQVGPEDEVVDLYSGVGVISLHLAGHAGHVTAIEADRASVKRAIINASLNPSGRKTYFFAGPVERLLPRVRKADVVVLNPPRAGADRQALAGALERLRPRKVVYSSCHLSTLCRDLETVLALGYVLTDLCLVDFFPQTRHFEVVVGVSRV